MAFSLSWSCAGVGRAKALAPNGGAGGGDPFEDDDFDTPNGVWLVVLFTTAPVLPLLTWLLRKPNCIVCVGVCGHLDASCGKGGR